MKNLLLILLLLAGALVAIGQGGTPDPAFGTNGIVTFDISLSATSARDVAVLPNGRILTVGNLRGEEVEAIILTRFLPTGNLDLKFGSGGKVTLKGLHGNNGKKEAHCLALQPDGRILVGGYLENTPDNWDFLLLRLLPSGDFDHTFGQDGVVLSNLGLNNDQVHSLAVQPDGKIVAVGQSGENIALARYLPDGTLDHFFGTKGIVVQNMPVDGEASALDVGIQADGKIVLAGYAKFNELIALLRYLPDGRPDLTFGVEGIVLTDAGGDMQTAYALALAPDGTILIAGNLMRGIVMDFDILLARYLPDGNLDPSFSGDGILTRDLTGTYWHEAASSVLVDAKGAITIAGVAGTDFFAARYGSGGVPDIFFGIGGIQYTHFFKASYEMLIPFGEGNVAMAKQSDGKLVLAGTSSNNQTLVRYLPYGSPDNLFGTNSIVQTRFFGPPSSDGANAIALQPDGKLVVAGSANFGGNINYDFCLARFLPDGSPDPAFGTQGRVTTDFGNTCDEANALVIQPDGKLVAAGYATIYGDKFALACYLPDGSLDPYFGSHGLVLTDFGNPQTGAYINALLLLPDGRLLAAGASEDGIVLARYDQVGALDPAFGTNGKLIIPFPPYMGNAKALALQTDGKIIVAGSNGDFLLLRLNPDGSPDLSFGVNGQVTTHLGNWNQMIQDVALQPDGKIVVVGTYFAPPVDWVIARYLPDGSLDAEFGTNGIVQTDVGSTDYVYAVALQTDGKILAAGFNSLHDVVLARYLPNGSLDPEFGLDGLVYTDLGGNQADAFALLVQPDHDIVVAGSVLNPETYFDLALMRYKPGVVNAVTDPRGPIEAIELRANPVTDNTTLVFSLKEAAELSVDIRNMQGQLVASPAALKRYPAGEQQLRLHTTGLAPGMYLVELAGPQGRAMVQLVKVGR